MNKYREQKEENTEKDVGQHMQNTSRTARSVKNAQVAIIFYCVNLILQFFSRKIFLDYLGSEVLGLNTTAQNLLGFLNLAELGIGMAIAYCLYKPLFDDDRDTINGIVSVQGWLYRRIAYVVIISAVVLMCFFPLIFNKAEVPLWYAYGSFSVLLFSSLLGYFVNYRQIVFSADQKEYKITYTSQGVKVLKVIIQILAIRYLNHGYIWWMSLEAVFAIITSAVLDKAIKAEYPWLKPNIKEGEALKKKYPQIITKTKQLFFHKIGSFVLSQTSPIIIYAYTSLTLVAIYGNYMLIITGVTMLVNSLLNGIGAGVGNLVAEGEQKKIKNFYWELTSLRLWMASVICFGIYMLGHPFIRLWVGTEYVMPDPAFIILTLITFVQLTRTNDIFISAYGLFQDIWAPVVEASLNLGLSILLGYFFGLTGILTGVLTSLLIIICCWKPYFLYSRGFKENCAEYFIRHIKYIMILGSGFIGCRWLITKLIHLSLDSWGNWILGAVVMLTIYGTVSLLSMWCLDKSARAFVKRLANIIGINLGKRI